MKLERRGKLVYDEELLGKTYVFRDRWEAGSKLGEACREVLGSAHYVLAVPMGGVPVGIRVSEKLGSKLDLILCRKLLIPWNREAGFGAVDPDGRVFVDGGLVRALGLSQDEVEAAIEEQLNEIKLRNEVLRGGRPHPDLRGLRVVLVDDGVAAGYTMSAAVNFSRSKGAREVVVATPTGSLDSLKRLAGHADLVLCLNVRSGPWFAVADAYAEWRDLDFEDVLRYLKEHSVQQA